VRQLGLDALSAVAVLFALGVLRVIEAVSR
jgi:hypothetical protein